MWGLMLVVGHVTIECELFLTGVVVTFDFNETKSASWVQRQMPDDSDLLFVHATTVGLDKIRVGGLDPMKSKMDRLLTHDPNVMRYNWFLYAFSLDGNGNLCKAHRMSQWAQPGNYAYVFSGSGRRYMSDRGLCVGVEVGFLDPIPWNDITPYKIGARFALEPL